MQIQRATNRMLQFTRAIALLLVSVLSLQVFVNAASAATEPAALSPAEQTEMVAAHNQWRQEVGVPELTWSPDLAATAQDWAGHLKQTRNCSMAHSNRNDMGENLAWRSPVRYSTGKTTLQKSTPTDITNAWGNEKQNYDYANNSCGSVCGHYTQLVWKSSKKVGCGRAICEDKSQVWVCNYSPPGNYVGQKPY